MRRNYRAPTPNMISLLLCHLPLVFAQKVCLRLRRAWHALSCSIQVLTGHVLQGGPNILPSPWDARAAFFRALRHQRRQQDVKRLSYLSGCGFGWQAESGCHGNRFCGLLLRKAVAQLKNMEKQGRAQCRTAPFRCQRQARGQLCSAQMKSAAAFFVGVGILDVTPRCSTAGSALRLENNTPQRMQRTPWLSLVH